jgi:iron complex outermembrane receptor protein
MMHPRFCVSRIFYVMMGLAGIATPFVDALAADQVTPAASGAGDAGKPAAVEAEATTQTKTVVSRKQIEEGSQQDGYGDAVKSVAGASSNNGAGSANDSIKFRGIQLGLYTNYRINGGLAITNVITIPTEDKEKVEALKGANALMFGLASPAGIINLVTKRPASKDVSTVTVSGNAFGQYGAATDLSRTFGDQHPLGVRINASGTHIATGVHDLSGRGEFASIAADWRLSQALGVRVDYEAYSKDVMEQGSIAPLAAVNGVIVVPRTLDPTKMLGATWGLYTPRTVNKSARADLRLSGNWKMLAEVGASNSERSRVQARTKGNYDVASGDGSMQIQWIKNQHYGNSFGRIELNGKFPLAGLSNDASFGYSSSERKANNPYGFGAVNTPINIYHPAPIPQLAEPYKPEQFAPSRNVENSVYVYDTVGIGAALKVLVGVRKSDAQFTSTNQKTLAQNTLKSVPTAPGAGVLWEFAPRTMLYGSYMRALEDGPTATPGSVNEFQILAPTESVQKEIGLRTELIKDTFANIDYFDIVRANAVASQVAGSHFNEFMYDGTSHLRGFEITANAKLNREWSVNGTAQLMRGTQRTEIDPALDGKTPENLAEVIGTFNLSYHPQWMNKLTLKAGATYTGPRFINALNQGKIPGVSLFSVGAAYQTMLAGHKTNLQLAISNLADKWYWNSVTSSAYGAGMERALRFSAKVAY